MILDVVYNHLGPDGNYLGQFSADYFTDAAQDRVGRGDQLRRRRTPRPVREFFIANAGYWIDEFHLDGLRLDATQEIYDDSPEHILAAIAHARAGRAPVAARFFWSAENEPQDARLVRPVAAAATASTRCGTTTSTTAPWWR